MLPKRNPCKVWWRQQRESQLCRTGPGTPNRRVPASDLRDKGLTWNFVDKGNCTVDILAPGTPYIEVFCQYELEACQAMNWGLRLQVGPCTIAPVIQAESEAPLAGGTLSARDCIPRWSCAESALQIWHCVSTYHTQPNGICLDRSFYTGTCKQVMLSECGTVVFDATHVRVLR
jgi:hypothetical protein